MKKTFTAEEAKRIIKCHLVLLDSLNKKSKLKNVYLEEIRTASNNLVYERVIDLLKTVSVDELNNNKQGFRVNLLKRKGIDTLALVEAASVDRLANIDGISRPMAVAIKNETSSIVSKMMSQTKIKLSSDKKTICATKLVIAIMKYKEAGPYVDKCIASFNQMEQPIRSMIDEVDKAKNGLKWVFLSQNKQAKANSSFEVLTTMWESTYGETARKSITQIEKIETITSEQAWGDFAKYTVGYFNILERINPGILGNDDEVYGLPKELADIISNQTYSIDGLLCELRKYQEWGVRYILHQKNVLLGDEMGLGKTVQAIAAMVALRNTGATHFIVVCPAGLLINWYREVKKMSTLSAYIIHGTQKRKELEKWKKEGGVAITNYESTGSIDLDDNFRFSMLVVDEAHYIKNLETKRSKNVNNLGKHTDRKLFMTGTALENNVGEMVRLIYMLNPEVAEIINKAYILYKATEFGKAIAPVYYRRKRDDVLTEIPELIENEEWCDMSSEEEKVYEESIRGRNYAFVRQVSWNVGDLKKSSKAKRLLEIIEEAKNENRKVIVFSFFLNTCHSICDLIGANCMPMIFGAVSTERRQEILDQFEKAPAGTVLVAQINAGGTGLNIQTASVVVICEPQFKPSVENQAISRAYRMGQTRNVLVHRLLCTNTVDEKMMALLKCKQGIFDAFADKSVAAEKMYEMDENSFGNIVQEEIDRINKKNGIVHEETDAFSLPEKTSPNQIINRTPAPQLNMLGTTGQGVPVTTRVNQITQPRGGFLPLSTFEMESFDDGKLLNEENIAANIIGLAVDYLTRYMWTKDARTSFDISLKGAARTGESDYADTLISMINGLEEQSIIAACRLVGYDVVYRTGGIGFKPVNTICPDKPTVENIRTMVERSLDFFKKKGPITSTGFTFEGGYTDTVSKGDGDYLTSDTLWDLKVVSGKLTSKNTLQLLMYYVMAKHSTNECFKNIKNIGFFNPRSNTSYTLDITMVPSSVISYVEEEVLCY